MRTGTVHFYGRITNEAGSYVRVERISLPEIFDWNNRWNPLTEGDVEDYIDPVVYIVRSRVRDAAPGYKQGERGIVRVTGNRIEKDFGWQAEVVELPGLISLGLKLASYHQIDLHCAQ